MRELVTYSLWLTLLFCWDFRQLVIQIQPCPSCHLTSRSPIWLIAIKARLSPTISRDISSIMVVLSSETWLSFFYLPKGKTRLPTAMFASITRWSHSYDRHISCGILNDVFATTISCRKRAGTQSRFIWCLIKSSLRTPLPLALVATWK